VCLVAPSGECLQGYKPADCSRLAPRVAASCLAKPCCYRLLRTGITRCAVLCGSLCVCIVFIDVLICSAAKAASVFNKLTLLYLVCICVAAIRRQKVKDLSKEKREKLSDNLLYAKFNRDVAEVKLCLW